MRYHSMCRFDRQDGKYVNEVVVYQDCGHNLIYRGGPDIMEEMIRVNGGSILGPISRCRECTRRAAEPW